MILQGKLWGFIKTTNPFGGAALVRGYKLCTYRYLKASSDDMLGYRVYSGYTGGPPSKTYDTVQRQAFVAKSKSKKLDAFAMTVPICYRLAVRLASGPVEAGLVLPGIAITGELLASGADARSPFAGNARLWSIDPE